MSLQNNNPNGYNKHKKNPKPIIIQPPIIDKEMMQEAYREKRRAYMNYLSKSQKFSFLSRKFLDIDRIDEEVCKEIEVKVH